MIAVKQIKADDRLITVRELTVGEIRAWLASAEAQDDAGVDVVGALLFEQVTLDDLARMCDVSVDEMNALPLSVINQVKAAAEALNADFFALRGRIIQAAKALAVAPPT